MNLCGVCSTIDFNLCFFGKQGSVLRFAHPLKDIQYIVDHHSGCPMCSLIYKSIQTRDPRLLENRHFACGWYDEDGLGDEMKRLQVQIGSMFLHFNLVIPEEAALKKPLRIRKIGHDQTRSSLPLLREWLETCKDGHAQCQHVWSQKKVHDFRLRVIDVNNRCIVHAPEGCKYVALSYVWGSSPTLRLGKKNLDQLLQTDGLRIGEIPATIEDAIRVTRAAQFGYLWVDALCTAQDDAEDKAHQIQNMDGVYGFAEFTIVAATGDSSHGLGALDPSSRVDQIEAQVKPGVRIALQFDGFDERQKTASRWITRAWTFQEALLSPRLVIFHENFVTWECRQAVWCEDTIPGSAKTYMQPQFSSQMLPILPQRLDASRKDIENPTIHPKKRFDNVSMYESAVKEYSRRYMSFDADKLNAFTGISKVFEEPMKTGFIFGLPKSQLDTALLWSAVEPLERLPDFPSWSWAGWKGAVRYASEHWMYLAPSIGWYTSQPSSSTQEELAVRLVRLRQAWEEENYVAPKRPWKLVPWASVNHPEEHCESNRSLQSRPPRNVLRRCLCFEAYCAAAASFVFHDQAILDGNNEVGGIVLDSPLLFEKLSINELEIVVLSHTSPSTSDMTAEMDKELEHYFPDNLTKQDSIPAIRGTTTPAPMLNCLRFLLVRKEQKTVSRIGMGEISGSALKKVGTQIKWVFLD